MKPAQAAICAPCIRGDMSFLASDELQGRGSGTRDEHLAALYAASLFAGFGLEPGGDQGSFLQKAPATLHPTAADRAPHGGVRPGAQNGDLERRGYSARFRWAGKARSC